MKLGVIKQIDKRTMGQDLPSWLDALLSPINQFFDRVTLALNRRLTFEENIQCTVKTLEFTSATEKKVNPDAESLRVLSMFVGSCESKTLTGKKLVLYNDDTVGITLTFAEGGSANCRVYLILGA